MQFSHEQLTLWYGTVDAPAPAEDSVQPRRGVGVTVAVQPPSPSNVVTLHYRVDDGPLQTLRAVRQGTDYTRGVELHRVAFPDFESGQRVAYLPLLGCSGRSAPDPATALTLPSSFRLAPAAAEAVAPPAVARNGPREPYALEYLASLKIPLKPPELIGTTPEGILVNWYWYPSEGTVSGPKLNAKVRCLGGDWMTIRRDGVGVMDVRATLETHDGALLYVDYNGYFDLGENGYADFLAGRWPASAPTRTTPRFHAAHAHYLWLNRVVCLGIGEVDMHGMVYAYDLYAVR